MASGAGQPFKVSGSVSVAAGTISNAAALAGAGDTVLVTNTSAALAHVALGASALLVADSTGVPVLPGSQILLGGAARASYAAAVLAAGAGQVIFTRGEGSVV
jgi:hypothetical protein